MNSMYDTIQFNTSKIHSVHKNAGLLVRYKYYVNSVCPLLNIHLPI